MHAIQKTNDVSDIRFVLYQGNVIQCINIKIHNIYKQSTLKTSNENHVLATPRNI